MKGFTLIELLISIALMTIIGTVTVATVTSVLRNANKTTLAGNIRQSGNYVLEQISDNVRYATQFNGVEHSYLDAAPQTSCVSPMTNYYHYLLLTTQTGNPVTFYCDASTSPVDALGSDPPYNNSPIASNGASLIDTSSMNVTSCSFTCTQTSSSAPPQIGISFTLSQKGTGNFSENNVSLPFFTSTLMNNINF